MSEPAPREFQERLIDLLQRNAHLGPGPHPKPPKRGRSRAGRRSEGLAGIQSFAPVPNFSAQVHRIMVNHFISIVRSKREYNDLDQVPEVGVNASQEERAGIRELNVAFQRLPKEQKEALHLIGLQEKSYEEAAETTGCAVGTVKSRVHRARRLLQAQMYGEIRDAA